MTVAVVDLLQIVQVKSQQSELRDAALRPFDLVIEGAEKTAIIGRTRLCIATAPKITIR
jgi:hypothetical protein